MTRVFKFAIIILLRGANLYNNKNMRLILNEENYNPESYADYLPNKHYHHSDKGCRIEMTTQLGNREGEQKLPGVIKKCLTHGIVCSKTGWEIGWYLGTKTNTNLCECGNILEEKKYICYDCRKKHAIESRLKDRDKKRAMANFKKIQNRPVDKICLNNV